MRDMINSNFMTAFLWDFIRQGLVVKTLQSPKLRKPVLNLALKIWQERIKKEGGKQAEDRYYLIKALVVTLQKALDNNISPSYLDGLTRIFAGKMVLGRGSPIQQKFKQRFGQFPPLFVLLCPTQNCNLKCTGCYTNSGGRGATLEPEIVDRIIAETKTLWDSHFIVLSGGEPTLYPHLFQLAAKHRDTEFLMYTNGTLITEEFAEKLARVGNIIPAISVEGFEKETDARRGEGVHAKILNAFANLRKIHVPFGISVTANRLNTDVITSDEFYDFYFEKEKVLFEWLFQYMPIGRAPTLDLMSTPEQRLKAREVKRRMERERNYFIGDFWNDGPGCNGCISAGRTGGYFNITGHGDCTACGFQPYAVANIREVYRNGGDLNTVFNSEFFQALRDWQNEYAYRKPAGERGDLLRECPIRDHYQEYRELVLKHHPYPIYPQAEDALHDEGYRKGMIEYDEALKKLTTPIWEEEYISSVISAKQKSVTENLTGGKKMKREEISEMVKEAILKAVRKGDEVGEAARESARKAIVLALEKTEPTRENVEKAVNEVMEGAAEGAREAGLTFSDIAGDLSEGVAEGVRKVNAGVDDLIELVGSAAQAAVSGSKKAGASVVEGTRNVLQSVVSGIKKDSSKDREG